MPELMSWSMSSPCSLPRAATDPKIVPMSVRLRPLICAVSATVLSTLVSWAPSATPDADRLAATVAASPRPNAVPFTDASASFMISVTLLLSWPRPLSFACAFSMLRARSKPPLAASVVMPAVMPATAVMPALPTLPSAPPSFEMRFDEPFLMLCRRRCRCRLLLFCRSLVRRVLRGRRRRLFLVPSEVPSNVVGP